MLIELMSVSRGEGIRPIHWHIDFVWFGIDAIKRGEFYPLAAEAKHRAGHRARNMANVLTHMMSKRCVWIYLSRRAMHKWNRTIGTGSAGREKRFYKIRGGAE